jgi:SOS-response transcriptional repressor LexA
MLNSEQQRLLDFIIAHKRQFNGNSPSYRQMMKHMEMTGTGQLRTVLKGLERSGKIVCLPGVSRGISIPGTAWDYVTQEVRHEVIA